MIEMDQSQTLDALESMIRDAKGVPLSASAVIPRQEALDLLRTLREGLPKETEEARVVLSERERIVAEAQQEAEKLLQWARNERARLISQTEVVQASEEEARRIVAEAEAAANKLKVQADDYVDAKLANFEILLNKVLRTVLRGREQLRQRLEAAQDELQPLALEDSGEISGPIPDPGAGPDRPREDG
jgi:hypothetical protein